MNKLKLRLIVYLLSLALIFPMIVGMASCVKKTTTVATKLLYVTVTTASPASLVVGFSQQFTAAGTYSDGSTRYISSEVTWASSDTTIAIVDSNGLATGVARGITNITATRSGITSPAVSLKVMSFSAIAVTPTSPDNLIAGSSLHFTVIGTYSDGSRADISQQVTWASSNTSVVAISSTGIVTGITAGFADITAAISGVKSPPVRLTVISLFSIALTPLSPTNLKVGSILPLTAIGTYSDGTTADISREVNWASSNITVATISPTGIVTGVAAGNTDIRAASSGITSGAVTLNVVAP